MKTKEKHNPFKGRFLIFSVLIFLFQLPIAVEASTIYLNSIYGEKITISYNGRTIHTVAGEFNTTLNDQDYNLEDFLFTCLLHRFE